MNKENKTMCIDDDVAGIIQREIDPEELWLDMSIEPEELIELDPLDVTDDMVEQAEHPELGDPLLVFLPR